MPTILVAAKTDHFVLASPRQQAEVFLAPTESECVRLAVQDLIADVNKITGIELRLTNEFSREKPTLVVGTVGVAQSDQVFEALNVPLPAGFSGAWERFMIEKVGVKTLLIRGSDERGTMFGVYDFLEKQLGVDPFYFWKDREPKKRAEISFESLSVLSKEPTFKYRGWFINDEDLLTEWKNGGGDRHIDYAYYSQVVHPDVMDRVVEALIRNKFNLIIPASFIDITNPPEEKLVERAARRGVFLSQHHVEPLGVSAFGYFNYWQKKDGTKPLFSFYSEREKLIEVWNHYAEWWAKHPNVIWQLGLRGIADRPMWQADPGVPQSNTERGRLISEAIAVQREIVQKYDQRQNPPMTATLWAEGSELFHRGHLKLPDETIIIFSDNSPGWRFQNDFYSIERKEEKRYGVYYHHQLWGSGPHLAQGISPFWTWTVFKETMEFRANDYAILNVSNVREFVLGLAASGQQLFDFENFAAEQFMEEWTKENFPSKPKEVQKLYDAYFSAFALHPERKVPLLLDGQTRQLGLSLLNTIQLYAKDKAKFLAEPLSPFDAVLDFPVPHPTQALRPAFLQSNEKNLVDMGLDDMHPSARKPDALLPSLRTQRRAFEKVAAQARGLQPRLTPEERQFLRTNLIAPSEIMLALASWCENLTLARHRLANGQEELGIECLRAAVRCLDRLEEPRSVLSEGDKWQFWYRGDKKMNLPSIYDKTKDTLLLLSPSIGAASSSNVALDPLTMQDGRKVTSPEQWFKERRPELLKLYEEHIYGKPTLFRTGNTAFKTRFEYLTSKPVYGSKGVQHQFQIVWYQDDDTHRVDVLAYVPKSDSKVPVFVSLNYLGNHTVAADSDIRLTARVWDREKRTSAPGKEEERAAQDRRWPIELLLDRGYAVVTAYYGDIEPDFPDGFRHGIRRFLYKDGEKPKPDEANAISTWAWGLGAMLDAVEHFQDKLGIDPAKAAVIGHSRQGQTALWTGANDPRFALVISNNSGFSGLARSQQDFGEMIHRIQTHFPHWTCGNFKKFNRDTAALPVDKHEMMALSAPRPIYVATATKDMAHCHSKGDFYAAIHADRVYKLLGTDGFGGVTEMPEPDRSVGGTIRYHDRTGGHDILEFDWKNYCDFADKFLK